MCDVRIEWIDETGKTHGGLYGLLTDQAVHDNAQSTVSEPHFWFRAKDGRIFGLPSKDVTSILAVRGG
jgi:hypothetical protein